MAFTAKGETTGLLLRWSHGDVSALDRLITARYGELRSLARSHLRRERQDHTLQPAALIHEAYLRLVGQEGVMCPSRARFFVIAGRTMRRILIEHARARGAERRGGGRGCVALEEVITPAPSKASSLVLLDEGLRRLADVAPQQAAVVRMRFFGGLSAQEIARVLGVSVPTVTRRWRVARAWLLRWLRQKTNDA